jgi:hypothetical protein
MIQFLWSWATPRQETYLAQTHFRKTETTRNHSHQNVFVIRTKVKPLYKQQTSHILTIHTIYNTQYTILNLDLQIQLWRRLPLPT